MFLRPWPLASTLALTLLVFATLGLSKQPKPQLCPGGRFLVQGESLVASDSAAPNEPVVIGGTQVALGDVCQSVSGKLKATKRGTRVGVRWPFCSGLTGPVRLKATIEPTCSLMIGTLRARKADVKKPFTARRSACGDQVVDRGAGEQCDGGVGCKAGERCTDACACVPGNTTTTTTSGTLPGATTTTVIASCLPKDGFCTIDDQCCSARCGGSNLCVCLGRGEPCTDDGQCCSTFCAGQRNTCECFDSGEDCRFGAQSCCSGACDVSGKCCGNEGDTCTQDTDCCSNGICDAGRCVSCLGLGKGCNSDPQCCSGASCSDNTCCIPPGGACTQDSCCSGSICLFGTCCAQPGQTCDSNRPCCKGLGLSGFCLSGTCCQLPGDTCNEGLPCCSGSQYPGICSSGTCVPSCFTHLAEPSCTCTDGITRFTPNCDAANQNCAASRANAVRVCNLIGGGPGDCATAPCIDCATGGPCGPPN